MRDLVHTQLPRSRWVALAHCNQHESRLRSLLVTCKDRSPLTSRLRDVELYTTFEARSILAFLFAAQKPVTRRTLVAQLGHHRLDRRSCRRRTANEILREHLIDRPNFEARTRARAHSCLSLAVGRQRSEVPVEFLGTHRRGPRPLSDLLNRGRLGRPVRREDELHLRRFLIGHRIDLVI